MTKLPRCLVLAFLMLAPMAAMPQSDSPGLPQPTPETAASVRAAVEELNRSPNTVVATVGSRSVTWGDVADVIETWPRISTTIPFQQLYESAALQVMWDKALADRAVAAGLEKDPRVQRQEKNAADSALATEMLRRSLQPNVTDQVLHTIYTKVFVNQSPMTEVQARVIAVDTPDGATGIIHRLRSGESFVKLAQTLSKDGTAANGGELGFVRLDMLDPVIGAVIFSLGVGETTSYPVRSGARWYVIQVEGRRQVAPPSFADVRWELKQDVLHAGATVLRQQALHLVPFKYYGLTGLKPKAKPH